MSPVQQVGRYRFLELGFPSAIVPNSLFGRFYLARCGPSADDSAQGPAGDYPSSSWEIYLRRPLFAISAWAAPGDSQMSTLRFQLPDRRDPGFHWLAARAPGDVVNLMGPFGREVELDPRARRLLLAAANDDAPLLIPMADQMLDQGGRVTFIVRISPANETPDRALISLLPLSVEVHVADSPEAFEESLRNAIAWSDTLVASESALTSQTLAQTIRLHAPWAHFSSTRGGAYFLVRADLACGFGACTACVVQRADGSLTRACIHGPAFPLVDLVG